MLHNVFAWTGGGSDSPAFIAVNRDEQGQHKVTVRAAGNAGRDIATIELSPAVLASLVSKVAADLASTQRTEPIRPDRSATTRAHLIQQAEGRERILHKPLGSPSGVPSSDGGQSNA